MDNLRKKILASAGWTGLLRYLLLVINITGGIYLARMVSPEIFGQIGLVVAVISFVTMASMWGFVPALLKKPGRVDENLEYIGTLSVIDAVISTVSVAILIAVAFFYPHMFGSLLIVMALSKLPMFLTEMYRASLVKDMLFNRLFSIHFISALIAMVGACILAYRGYGLGALVFRYAIENICISVLSFLFVHHRAPFRYNKTMAKEFFHFGKFAFVSGALEGGYNNLDRISIGSFLGSAVLGFYERAHGLAGYINLLCWEAVSPVFESLFGKFRDDRQKLSYIYNMGSCFFLRAYLCFFIWLGLLLPELISIIYCKQWLPVVSIFRLLVPFFILLSLRQFNRTLQLYIGNSKTVALVQAVELCSFVFLFFPLMHFFKIQGVAIALNVSMVLGITFFLYHARKVVDIRFKEILLVPVLISFLTFIVFFALRQWTVHMTNMHMFVLANTTLIFLTFFVLTIIFERRLVLEFVRLFQVRKL